MVIHRIPSVSLIIRTKNEGKLLDRVLTAIKQQTLQPAEIILVDNESSDGTIEIAKQYGCIILSIPNNRFGHAYSCNLGARKARFPILAYLNGHSIPASNTWLESGASHFTDSNVAGVYTTPIYDNRASFWEKISDKPSTIGRWVRRINRVSLLGSIGIMGTTNSMLRRDLWEKHPFLEDFDEKGGEDVEWAYYFLTHGYIIVDEPDLATYHAHGDSLRRWVVRRFHYARTTLKAYFKYVFR